MTPRDAATERQVQAARPGTSTWLAANAGSGKTRVLTDRVARLLLTGVSPEHILCLTYTKAAASEMQNRLFVRLGKWAMLNDDGLRSALQDLGVDGAIEDADLRQARTLFARAIETPGGLKIQTIHSFCSALLRRFPLEAGVSPRFREIEDRAAELLMAEVLDDMSTGADGDVVDAIAAHLSDEQVTALTREIVKHRSVLSRRPDRAACFAMFGADPDDSAARIASDVFGADGAALIATLIDVLPHHRPTDKKDADKLRDIGAPGPAALPVLENVFLFGEKATDPFGPKIGKFPTKDARTALGDRTDALDAFIQRVHGGRQRRLALAAAEKTWALHRFAHRFLDRYAQRKLTLGWLDFDDLILKAQQLFNDPALAQWVLYRLDGGIDHILVDEAQDTSPPQWDVIDKLTQEFTAGYGARPDVTRTLFVVGDIKQSIYSFQGADPGAFARMKTAFSDRFDAAQLPISALDLEHSFRSSRAVLDVVDQCFAPPLDQALGHAAHHRAFKSDMPGRVDLWPVVAPADKQDEDRAWFDPVDRPDTSAPPVVLARRIAREIRRMTDPDRGETIPEEVGNTGVYRRRPVRAGDFLILVQRRSVLFQEIIRACKAEGLDVAGADRLKVGAEVAVKDLAALLNFLALPEDDLSLAVALRSPLFGWSEQDLYALAQPRGGAYLWEALRGQRDRHPETLATLESLRNDADFLRPYDLIERILTRFDGRRKLLARLGPEAEDGIDALLSQALAYESAAVPSLTGFLVWMETEDLEIKRQMDSAGNRIRVMTVHGAKGLEAPIVILPDTAKREVQIRDQLVPLNGSIAWKTRSADAPDALRAAMNTLKARQAAERMRLLYVAMTRAERWLIVAAAGDVGGQNGSWYTQIEAGMSAAGAIAADFGFGPGMRYTHLDWSAPAMKEEELPFSHVEPLPAWAGYRAPTPQRAPRAVLPSTLGGAKALPGDAGQDETAALRHGTFVHLLLERLPALPRSRWPEVAMTLLRRLPDPASETETADALAEALGVLDRPDFAPLFAPDTLAEVPVTADLDALAGRRVYGVIDRLVIGEGTVLAVDFKTNAMVPDTPQAVPEGLLRQVGAYVHALAPVFPDHRIGGAILWTARPFLMHLPHDLVTRALHRSEIS